LRRRKNTHKVTKELEDKECPYLMMQGELVKRVVDACRWDAGKVSTTVVRLMGGKFA
jgi:hypothetical protein